MHEEVSILFTDIVGFTAMSQECMPYQVMQFLHALFLRFDDLCDMDDSLWKVETIGDAVSSKSYHFPQTEKRLQDPISDFIWSLSLSLSRQFMVASGLEVGKRASSENEGSGSLQSKCSSRVLVSHKPNIDPQGSADSAIKFGRSAIRVAARLTMPNGQPCQIRAGEFFGKKGSRFVGPIASKTIATTDNPFSLTLLSLLTAIFRSAHW